MAFDRRKALALLREQSDGLADRLETLAEADWRRPSPCPGWCVADVMAHLSSGAAVQLRSLRKGLAGDTSPAFKDQAERDQLTDAKLRLPESTRAADYRREMALLLDFLASRSDADMAKTAWHQSGVYPLPWFYLQRLGETTMHRGDVHGAFAEPSAYPEQVAALLLPIYVARLPRLRLGEADALISFGQAGAVRLAAGSAEYMDHAPEATLSLDADADTLLRVVVGRLHPQEALATGRLQATGDLALLEHWREVFRTL